VLGLLGELLQQPALPGDKLSMVQAQVANIISHRDDNASSVARRCGAIAKSYAKKLPLHVHVQKCGCMSM
jgi:hypothetical protein